MTEENDHTVTTDQEIATPIMTHRVKFYQLNQDTNWEDKGTGHCIYREVKIWKTMKSVKYVQLEKKKRVPDFFFI